MTDDELYALRDRAAARFMDLPGVTAVGIGGRERGGEPTGDLAIAVFVARKRPVAELAPDEVLPPEFGGLPVDVQVAGPFRHLGSPSVPDGPGGSPDIAFEQQDNAPYRPLVAGTRITPSVPGAPIGTLGCFLQHSTDPSAVYAMTCFHVLEGIRPPERGVTRMGQPTNQESVAKCCTRLFGTHAGGGIGLPADRALVRLDPGTEYRPEILQIGPLQGEAVRPTADEILARTYHVRKRGKATRLTSGAIIAIVSARVDDHVYPDTYLVEPLLNDVSLSGTVTTFAQAGDSGSAVVRVVDVKDDTGAVIGQDRRLAGMLFGSSNTDEGIPNPLLVPSVVAPIDLVLTAFLELDAIPVQVVTAEHEGEVRTVPPAPTAARPHVAEPVPELAAPSPAGLPSYPELLARVGGDLERSPGGRALVALWLEHQDELLDLVGNRRRVTIAWHRGGGAALFQVLLRMAADPDLPMPRTINGVPPLDRLDRLYAVVHAHASPALRASLESARSVIPDPASLTYDQILTALTTR